MNEQERFEKVAIIGMSGRFPGAAGMAEFWDNLCKGVESVTSFTDRELLAAGVPQALLEHPSYVKKGILLDGLDLFDARFFGFSPRDAALMDPQHRILLECAWEAMEDAGYNPTKNGDAAGVFAGAGMNTYYTSILSTRPDAFLSLSNLQRMIAADKDYLATRISYQLNLKGPSMTVQSGCSTSLVAVHLACQSLLSGECDIAIAGGVSLHIPQVTGYLFEEGSTLSPDGHCRTFDANARGMVVGSGAGVVVLKRLNDALSNRDCIRAVIRGSCVNNDGSGKVGYTAPSVEGQARVISDAQAMAAVRAEQISYVEAHGTGTALGDPIEVAALSKAFDRTTEKKGFCAIGSLKPNIGHLDAAAGIAGLIKVVLCLQHRMLPPSINFTEPNPQIDFSTTPFHVQNTLSEWKRTNGRLMAGVSSFGIGGTNAHLVVEEAPVKPVETDCTTSSWRLIMISAKSNEALEKATNNLVSHLERNSSINLSDVAFTLQNGRAELPCRRMVAASSSREAADLLRADSPSRMPATLQERDDRAVTFMFPGQAAQYVNMGRGLYTSYPVFRETLDRCTRLLAPVLGLDLLMLLYPTPERAAESSRKLDQTAITQPAMFALEYSLATLWMAWGVMPEAMIGHSLGEYVAACLSGVFSLEDALRLVAERGRLMQGMPKGAMVAISLGEKDVLPFLDRDTSLSVVNTPASCVVGGTCAAVHSLQKRLAEKQIGFKVLATSHAFHSPMMEPMLEQFQELFATIRTSRPRIPFISNLTGTWIEPLEAGNPAYWTRHLRSTVRFSDGAAEILKTSNAVLLEVGPGNTLSSLVKQHPAKQGGHSVVSSLPHGPESEPAAVMNALGQLWLSGARVDWQKLSSGQGRRIPLPTYPFERRRCWIDSPGAAAWTTPEMPTQIQEKAETENTDEVDAASQRMGLHAAYAAPRDELETAVAGFWREILGTARIGRDDDFFELGGDSLLATRLLSRIKDRYDVTLTLKELFSTVPTIAGISNLIKETLISELEQIPEEEAMRRLEESPGIHRKK